VWGTKGRFRGRVWGTTGRFRDRVWGTTVRFRGRVWGTTCRFSGRVWGTTCRFSGRVLGTTGRFRGRVWGTTGRFSGRVWGNTGRFSGRVWETGRFSVCDLRCIATRQIQGCEALKEGSAGVFCGVLRQVVKLSGQSIYKINNKLFDEAVIWRSSKIPWCHVHFICNSLCTSHI